MVTPEPLSPPKHRMTAPAGLGIRLVARIIDAVIVGIVLFVLLRFIGEVDNFLVTIPATAVAGIIYFVVLESAFGATIGKKLLGLRVYGPDSDKPTVVQSAVRNMFMVSSIVPYIGGLIDLILRIVIAVTIHNSPSKQGVHDRWSGGTQVVHSR